MTHTKDEALKLALEALDGLTAAFLDAEGSYGAYEQKEIDRAYEVITAIKEAAAQPVQPQHSATLQSALAELHLYEEICQHYAQCNISPEALRDWVAERVDKPAQQQRQPLSDEQIIDLAVQWPAETNDWASHFDFARAIEAKLKEINS